MPTRQRCCEMRRVKEENDQSLRRTCTIATVRKDHAHRLQSNSVKTLSVALLCGRTMSFELKLAVSEPCHLPCSTCDFTALDDSTPTKGGCNREVVWHGQVGERKSGATQHVRIVFLVLPAHPSNNSMQMQLDKVGSQNERPKQQWWTPQKRMRVREASKRAHFTTHPPSFYVSTWRCVCEEVMCVDESENESCPDRTREKVMAVATRSLVGDEMLTPSA